MKTTSPVSSDWQISSHFWASVGKGNTLSRLGSQKVGWLRLTLEHDQDGKSQGPALGNAGRTSCGAGHKSPAMALRSHVTLGNLSDLSEPQFLIYLPPLVNATSHC